MEKNEQQMPRLGEPVPAFEAMTTKGKISFPDDYKGKWVILFSHPADFTRSAPPKYSLSGRIPRSSGR